MTDQDQTDQMPEAEDPTEVQPPAQPPAAKRLVRSRSDRMLGGVAGGLGEYFSVDSLIFRIGFGVSVFFGGLGALAYLALLLFVPAQEDDGTVGEAPVQRSRWLAATAAVGVFVFLASMGVLDGEPFFFGGPLLVLLAAGALFYALRREGGRSGPAGILITIGVVVVSAIALGMLALAAAWAGATGNGEAVAITIVAIGALLVLAALRGGARWLIVPALALALPLGAVAATDISFDEGVGERRHTPVNISGIPADGYSLGVGHQVVDLREIDWKPNTVVRLSTDHGLAETVVYVPEDVCVTGKLEIEAGDIDVPGQGGQADGLDVSATPNAGATATPRLVLDATADVGQLRVINDDDAGFGHDRGPFGSRSSSDGRDGAMNAACR